MMYRSALRDSLTLAGRCARTRRLMSDLGGSFIVMVVVVVVVLVIVNQERAASGERSVCLVAREASPVTCSPSLNVEYCTLGPAKQAFPTHFHRTTQHDRFITIRALWIQWTPGVCHVHSGARGTSHIGRRH